MCKTKKQLTVSVAKYRELKAKEAKLKAELDAVKQDLFEKVVGPDYTLSYSIGKSTSWNQDELKAALGVDDLQPFKNQTEFKRLNVA